MTDKSFHSMVEQMLLSLNNFASHGSGWTLDRIENIEVRLVKNKPISASSYLALPGKLSGMSALLNIRNREDEHCFLYCYTAAYHLKYGLPTCSCWFFITQDNQPCYIRTKKSNCETGKWRVQNANGLSSNGRFEELNEVCVNVFR